MFFSSNLIMMIIIYREVWIQQGLVGIVKHVIASITEIARILFSPFVVHCHQFGSKYLAYRTLSDPWFNLKCYNWISKSILYVFGMDQPHISDNNSVLAITLDKKTNQEKHDVFLVYY